MIILAIAISQLLIMLDLWLGIINMSNREKVTKIDVELLPVA